jgi:FtsZ-interacting cell division protein ZipA
MRATDVERVPVPEVPIVVDIAPVQLHDMGMRSDLTSIPVHGEGPSAPPLLTKVAQAISTTSPIAEPKEPPPPVPPRILTHRERRSSPPAAAPPTESSDRIALSTPSPNTALKQKIVSVRVCAPGEVRWPGNALLAALEAHGLAYGRYQVFHRRHVDGRSLFCVANLKEPGSFDVTQMPAQEFKGVAFFAVLPGPLEPLLTVDEMLAAARELAQALTGMVQDAKGVPLSPQRAGALRDEVASFQASLSVPPAP